MGKQLNFPGLSKKQAAERREYLPARCHYGFNEKCAKATVNGDSVAPRGDKLKRRTLLSNFHASITAAGESCAIPAASNAVLRQAMERISQ